MATLNATPLNFDNLSAKLRTYSGFAGHRKAFDQTKLLVKILIDLGVITAKAVSTVQGNAASTVAADPVPSASVFGLQPGDGVKFREGEDIIWSGAPDDPKAVSSIDGDVLTLAAPLSDAPTAGDAITQTLLGTGEFYVQPGDGTKFSEGRPLVVGSQHRTLAFIGGDELVPDHALTLPTGGDAVSQPMNATEVDDAVRAGPVTIS